MTNRADLEAHAARLLELAAKAKKNGDAKYADWLADKATARLDEVRKLEGPPGDGEPTDQKRPCNSAGPDLVT